MSEPQFLKDLKEKRDAAQKEVSEGFDAWGRAQDAILKFPGWELTGDRREPVKGDDYLSEDRIPEPLHCHVNPSGKYPPEIRFILRKVEPPNLSKYPGWVWTGEYRLPKAGEKILFNNGTFWVAQFDFERDRCYILKSAPVSPEPQPDREEAIRKAKSDAYNLRLNTNRFDFPKVRGLVEAVEAIPDRGPSPRVVWACPGEILNSLKVFKKTILMDQALGKEKLSLNLSGKYLRLLDHLLDFLRSTREATVEEVDKACDSYAIRETERLIRYLNRDGIRLVKEEKPCSS